jgi:hypothetical protein
LKIKKIITQEIQLEMCGLLSQVKIQIEVTELQFALIWMISTLGSKENKETETVN